MWAVYDFDPDTGIDVAYILLADVHPGEDAITIVQVALRSVEDDLHRLPAKIAEGVRRWRESHPAELAERSADDRPIAEAVRGLMLEFDRDNRLVAIEIWGASEILPMSFLEMAAAETRPKPIASK